MSYHNILPFIANYCKLFNNPKILEIGVEYGVTPLTLLNRMPNEEFQYIGIDIHYPQFLPDILNYSFLPDQKTRISLYEANSLKFLPWLIEQLEVANVEISLMRQTCILVDGDHNYYTVKQELDYLLNFADKHTIFICDDYGGKWSEKDLFYSTRETHKGTDATPVVAAEYKGVKPAIDQFIKDNPEWRLETFKHPEAVILIRKDNPINMDALGEDTFADYNLGEHCSYSIASGKISESTWQRKT